MKALLISISLVLSGCATAPQDPSAIYGPQCEAAGWAKGSEQWANCTKGIYALSQQHDRNAYLMAHPMPTLQPAKQ